MDFKGEKDYIPQFNPDKSIEYPLFCFKYFQIDNKSFKKCKNKELLHSFVERLHKLSIMGWTSIHKSERHSYGWEKLPLDKIKCKNLPSIVTDEIRNLYAFRYTGKNHPFLGLRNGNVFHVIFIETNFGDVYNHN